MINELQTAIESLWTSDPWLGLDSNVHGLYLDGTEGNIDYPFALYSYEPETDMKDVKGEEAIRLEFMVFAETKASCTTIIDNIRSAYKGVKLSINGYDNFMPCQTFNPGKIERDLDRRFIGTISFNLKISEV